MSGTLEDFAEESVVADEDDDELEEDDSEEEEGPSTGNMGEDEGSEKLREDDVDEDDSTVDDEEDDELTVKSDDASAATPGVAKDSATPKQKGSKHQPGKGPSSGSKRGRSPSVKGLTIPFRTVKKAMKVDPDTPIVQNEAAVMTTIAAELFLKSLAIASFRNAKRRGRSTIRYEDISEARTNNPALSFLETLLP